MSDDDVDRLRAVCAPEPGSGPVPLRPGERVAHRFEVAARIGAGGMGIVYRARDLHAGGLVALKLLHLADAVDRGRFAREATILAGLSHPAIVRYLAHGATLDGRRYLAMEWLDGETLGALLARRTLGVAASLTLALRVSDALGAAHRLGIVHRDVKPRNLFLVGGRVEHAKLLDFGIARRGRDPDTPTRKGVLVGTPGYLSPEQVFGLEEPRPDADVFALGCVLFECLTGRTPFAGDDEVSALARLLMEEAPPLRAGCPEASEALEALVARMLAKDPSARPRDGEAVVAEILALGSLPLSASEAATVARAERPETAPRMADEQRVTSVLAVRLSGAPAPEESLDAVRSVLERHGLRAAGIGRALLVVTFPPPGNPVDLASRAVRCGLAVRAALPGAGVAVATGPRVVSEAEPRGELIDRCASAADSAGDRVRLDEATAALVAGRFEIERVDDGPVVRAERGPLRSARTLLGAPTPLVGRDRELAALEAMFDESSAEVVARAVLVTGPAGSGKSRLLEELLGRLGPRLRGALVLVGRGDPLAAGAPYSVLGPAVREACGISGAEALETRRTKLRALLGRHLSGEALLRATELLAEMAGVPVDAGGAGDALRAARRDARLKSDAVRGAWLEWLAAEAGDEGEPRPIAILLDDLHQGDLPTVELVDAALRALGERPLVVVAFARPEVHQQFPRLWDGRGLHEVRLTPLPRRACERLVRGLLGPEADEGVVSRIVQQGEGNPFCVEELARLAAVGAGDRLPETVLAIAQARLDALGADARRVLRAASVFGGWFPREALHALLASDRGAVGAREWLEELAAREVLETRPTSEGEPEYAFRHPLVREAAYQTLTEEDRARAHRRAGEWLERTGEREAGLLAEHFDRGAAPERAAGWWLRAARQSLEANDLGAAVERAERGVACAGRADGPSDLVGRLRLVQAEALAWRGELAAAGQQAAEAARLLPRASAAWFDAVRELIAAHGRLGRADEVVVWAREAAAEAPAEDGLDARLLCLCRAARQVLVIGRLEVADRVLEEIDRVAEVDRVDPIARAQVHDVRATRALHDGDVGRYLEGEESALGAYERAGDVRGACLARVAIGYAYAQLGAFGRAEGPLREAFAAAERLGFEHVASWALENLGNVLAHQGRLEEARGVLERTLRAARTQGDLRLEGGVRIYLATVAHFARDFALAEREAGAAEEVLRASPPLRAGALAWLARARIGLGRPRAALEAAREAMDLLAALGGIDDAEALVRLALAEALEATGEEREAADAIRTARDRLLVRAGRIRDPEWRTSFLERVPENAKTLSLARDSLGGH